MSCCTWHRTGGSAILACGDRNASGLVVGHVVPAAGLPMAAAGVQGPFAGPDWQAECLAAREDRDRLARDVARLEREVERLETTLAEAACDYVDCICPGCPRKVPRAWASGMCEPCAAVDCEHTDGAREVEAKARELAAEVTKWEEQHQVACEHWGAIEAERDRLRAVLANTTDNVMRVAAIICEAPTLEDGLLDGAAAATGVLAALRAGAPAQDSEAAVVNRDQREAGAQAQPAGAAAAPTGQAGGAQSGSAGPPAGLTSDADPLADSNPMCPRHPGQLCVAFKRNGLCVYTCAIDNGHPPRSADPPAGPASWPWVNEPGGRLVHVGVDPAAPGADRTVDAGGIEVGPEGERPRYHGLCCDTCGAMGPCDCSASEPVIRGPLKPACALQLIAGGRELMRVMNGVTPADLRAQGFPDVAAALERGSRVST
jgi:hypothetical protein